MTKDITKKMVEDGDKRLERDEQGRFLSGNTEGGRLPDTPEQKIIKKATKELIKDYIDKLAEALPQISPALIAKAIAGDIQAIKEVNDRVLGRPKLDITSGGEPINRDIELNKKDRKLLHQALSYGKLRHKDKK